MKTYKVIFYDSEWNDLFTMVHEAKNKKELKSSIQGWLARGPRWGVKKFVITQP